MKYTRVIRVFGGNSVIRVIRVVRVIGLNATRIRKVIYKSY